MTQLGAETPLSQSLASRVIQSRQFAVPALADLNDAEWRKYGGDKLVGRMPSTFSFMHNSDSFASQESESSWDGPAV